MAKKAAAKKTVEKVVEEVKDEGIEVEVVVEELTFTEKTISRRGKTITIRTYSDGKVEEL